LENNKIKRFKILLYEDMHETGKAILAEKADVFFASSYEKDLLIPEARDVNGIITRANGKVTRSMMESAPKLKVVGRPGVGVENIDLEAGGVQGPPEAAQEGEIMVQ
jgi:D-3-phosphoglycerate dehydrogenase